MDKNLFSDYSPKTFQVLDFETAQSSADDWNDYVQDEPDDWYVNDATGETIPRDVCFVAHSSEVESPNRKAEAEGYLVVLCRVSCTTGQPLWPISGKFHEDLYTFST